MSYGKDLKIINEPIEDIDNWLWVKEDTTSWPGPRREWINDHYSKFFKYLRNRNVVITAGANCGMHARLFADKFKLVYAFEPDSLNFHCLVNNCQFDNVIKIMGALGSENGMSNLYRSSLNECGSHRMESKISEYGILPVFSIDSFNFNECDFIQLDAEGSEPFILEGAIKTIKKFKPVISVETIRGVDYPGCVSMFSYFEYERVDLSGSDSVWVHKDYVGVTNA